MGRLIPLKLPARVSLTTQKGGAFPETPTRPSSPPSAAPPPVPPRSPKRSGLTTPAEMHLPLPVTPADWHRLLNEVRAMYLKRQYHQCSTRCIQVLEDAGEPMTPLHSIYLSFYAATCLELTARPLHTSSPRKLLLFELARFHYQKAEFHLASATMEDLPPAHNRQASFSSIVSLDTSLSSKRSSLSSSTSSLFDHDRTSTPLPTSPTSSVYTSFSDSEPESLKPRPLLVRKKVAFAPTLPTVISASNLLITNEASMPDHSCSNIISLSTIRNALAMSPSATSDCTVTTTRSRSSSDLSVSSISSSTKLVSKPEATTSTVGLGIMHISTAEEDSTSRFLLSRSIKRYNTHLESMSTQLHYHISVLEALIEEAQNSRVQSSALSSPNSPDFAAFTKNNVYDDVDLKRAWKRGNKPDFFDNFEGREKGAKDDEKACDEKKGLRRERVDVWLGRERFDGRRWEELAGRALSELRGS